MRPSPEIRSGAACSTSAGDVATAMLAILIIVWAVARACLQSITLDEAMTYRVFVGGPEPHHFLPSSNNHVLNSLLMRLTTSIFGLSQVSVRLPALAGACVYLASCFFLCRSIFERSWTRVAVFACLALNPFLCDFYVAARGHSLAVGFLTCAIALIASRNLRAPADPRRRFRGRRLRRQSASRLSQIFRSHLSI